MRAEDKGLADISPKNRPVSKEGSVGAEITVEEPTHLIGGRNKSEGQSLDTDNDDDDDADDDDDDELEETLHVGSSLSISLLQYLERASVSRVNIILSLVWRQDIYF
jgi:hypothetical protein